MYINQNNFTIMSDWPENHDENYENDAGPPCLNYELCQNYCSPRHRQPILYELRFLVQIWPLRMGPTGVS